MRSAIAIVLCALAAGTASGEPAPDGGRLYFQHCAACHGLGGAGDGPDASLFRPPPRNLRDGFLQERDPSEIVKAMREGARRPLALDPDALRARLQDTDAIVDHLEAMPNTNWRLVARGQDVYLARCASCHGEFGRPPWKDSDRQPPDLSSAAFQRKSRDADLVRTIREGHESMRTVPAVRDTDAGAIVAFVRILSPGFELYSRHCAGCHGDDGRPPRDFTDPRQRPSIVFDRTWLEGQHPERLHAAVSHMLEGRTPGMPHFRKTLSDEEARAIVGYLGGAK